MKTIPLEKYLQAIRECPDEELIKEGKKEVWLPYSEKLIAEGKITPPIGQQNRLFLDYGLYDNWPILLNSSSRKLQSFFGKDNKFVRRSKELPGYHYWYLPGTVSLSFGPNSGMDNPSYPAEIMLFSSQRYFPGGKVMPGVSSGKALSFVAEDIGQFILRNGISAEFPKAKFKGQKVLVKSGI